MDLGSIWMGLTLIWEFWVDFIYFLHLFWGSRFDAKKCATSAPNVFLRHICFERRPLEGLRRSLPLSALPVLAGVGLSWTRAHMHMDRIWSTFFDNLSLLFCFVSFGDLGAVLGLS